MRSLRKLIAVPYSAPHKRSEEHALPIFVYLRQARYNVKDLICPYYNIDSYVELTYALAAEINRGPIFRASQDPKDKLTKAIGISMLNAIKTGQLETLKYLNLLRPLLGDVISLAINSGHLNILKYALENEPLDVRDLKINIDDINEGAKAKVEIIDYLYKEVMVIPIIVDTIVLINENGDVSFNAVADDVLRRPCAERLALDRDIEQLKELCRNLTHHVV